MASVNDLLFGLLQLSILSIYKTATQDFYQGYEKTKGLIFVDTLLS